ncbi:MAG: hypothetical protein GY940_08975, partial [bacterium]|nr:hypothetical protein [bacterium]
LPPCPFPDSPLADLAYTLQVGREAMEERLGLIVHSKQELQEKLLGFIQGGEDIEDLYLGQVKRNKKTLEVFTADEEFRETIAKWIQRKKFSKLLDLWVNGLTFDWSKLYGDRKPRRISAPTYPFARESYWVETRDSRETGGAGPGKKSYLHPLLQENTSNLSEQRFSSTFTGEEFFLKDHRVKGEKILPGVAYLEMAREAVKQAAQEFSRDNRIIRLKNVVWVRPIAVGDKPAEVNIGLFPGENGEIAYQIYTHNPNPKEEPLMHIVHSQG